MREGAERCVIPIAGGRARRARAKETAGAPSGETRMTGRLTHLFLAALLAVASMASGQSIAVPDAENLVGRPAGSPLRGAELTRRTLEVSATIRCPVCQGLSVADSPSEMARNMKSQVEALLARGYTEEQILDYFERSYGQFVRLRPKFQGVNSLVWILPVAALAIGVSVVFIKLRKLEQRSTAADPVTAEPIENDPYLARVRQLVKGEPE